MRNFRPHRSTIHFTFHADDNGAAELIAADIPAEIAYRYTPADPSVGFTGQVDFLSVLPLGQAAAELTLAGRRELGEQLLAVLEDDSLPYGAAAEEKCAEDAAGVLAGER